MKPNIKKIKERTLKNNKHCTDNYAFDLYHKQHCLLGVFLKKEDFNNWPNRINVVHDLFYLYDDLKESFNNAFAKEKYSKHKEDGPALKFLSGNKEYWLMNKKIFKYNFNDWVKRIGYINKCLNQSRLG